ncbi:MAG: hypothetical protein V1781_04430, partial [Bacteroidota bacterium]
MKEKNVAMQERCVFCGREQYAPAVYPISMGEQPCTWCGKISKKMTKFEYLKKLKKINNDK